MSVYQYIYFSAVDKQLDDKQLAYMRRQSSRAVVTRWQFENEYHYGDFHGNTLEMMRRGYDVHLHYANSGIRKVMLRLPQGLPVSLKHFKTYAVEYALEWKKDTRGKSGVLSIQPDADSGGYGEDYFDFQRLIALLPKVRDMLIGGDPRTLYLGWLACNGDEDAIEPPVPAGLKKLPPELIELAEFYEIDRDLISAAALLSPKTPARGDRQPDVDKWLKSQTVERLRDHFRRVLDGDAATVRAECLAEIRKQSEMAAWPVAEGTRTREELQDLADAKAAQRQNREMAAEQRRRAKRIAEIRRNPNETIQKAERLIQSRSVENYTQAAKLLVELRDAFPGMEGSRLADKAAKQLARKFPTLSCLKRALKAEGLEYK
jgi:hypothetical protein